jgi:acetate kinase
MPPLRVIVSLNCGSSSLKFAAYRIGPGKEELLMIWGRRTDWTAERKPLGA